MNRDWLRGLCGATGLLIALTGAARSAEAFTVTSFGPGQWRAADVTLGFTHAMVEDFESTALASGLSYQVTGTAPPMAAPATTLPNLFDPTMDPIGQAFMGATWDGTHVFINTYDNQSHTYAVNSNWGAVTFSFEAGATKVGFSLEQLEIATDGLAVNGTMLGTIGSLPGASNLVLCAPTACENGYLVISAGAGETINSVTIGTANGDGWAIDHLLFENAATVDAGIVTDAGVADGGSGTDAGQVAVDSAVPVGTIDSGAGNDGSPGTAPDASKSGSSSSGCTIGSVAQQRINGAFVFATLALFWLARREHRHNDA